jgi:hypothetical protein
MMQPVALNLLLLVVAPAAAVAPSDPADLLQELQGLADDLPALVTLLLSGPGEGWDLGEAGQEADAWFGRIIPDLRRLLDTLVTLVRMLLKVADKAGASLDRVEVETAQLIFQGLFSTLEELVTTVLPILDLLPAPVRIVVSKQSLLKLLNIEWMRKEIFHMEHDMVMFYIKVIKSVPLKKREEGLALLRVVGKMLRLSEEDADYSQFDGLFSEVLQILPVQVQNVQNLVRDFTAVDSRLKKKSVIFQPGPGHQEL